MIEKSIQYFSSCSYLTPVKKQEKKKIHRLKQNCTKHSLLYYEVNFIHSRIVTEKKTGKLVFRLPHPDTPNCAGSVLVLSEILSLGNLLKGVWCLRWLRSARPGLLPQSGPKHRARLEVEVLLLFPRWARSSGVASTLLRLYCVVTSFTIMLMIRDPRGHVHRSMLGFFILSWRSWSSSQRSSFTNSAT